MLLFITDHGAKCILQAEVKWVWKSLVRESFKGGRVRLNFSILSLTDFHGVRRLNSAQQESFKLKRAPALVALSGERGCKAPVR